MLLTLRNILPFLVEVLQIQRLVEYGYMMALPKQ